MQKNKNQGDSISEYEYLLHIFIPILAAILVNAFIYLYGWNSERPLYKGLPPGYVIAVVWIIILGMLGYAHYLTYYSYASWIIVIALIYCLLYPFLTGLSKGDSIHRLVFQILFTKASSRNRPEPDSYFYNVIALLIAIVVCVTAYLENQKTIWFTLPFLLWTLYVSIITNKYVNNLL